MYVGNVRAPLCSLVRVICCYLFPAYRLHTVLRNTVPPVRTIVCTDFYLDQVVLPDSMVRTLAGNLSYWVILSIFSILEYLVDPLLQWLPLYEILKLAALLWIALGNGSTQIYRLITKNRNAIQLPTFDSLAGIWRDKFKELWVKIWKPPHPEFAPTKSSKQ